MKIENVHSEALTQKDDYIKLQNGIIDEPSAAIPWRPKIVSTLCSVATRK